MATCKKCGYPKTNTGCACTAVRQVNAERERRNRENNRSSRQGQSTYGRNSRSGNYGSGTYSFTEATFDGFPALKRNRDGKTEFFYGTAPVDIDNEKHGHAIIKNGKLIYKRRPGESTPIIDIGG